MKINLKILMSIAIILCIFTISLQLEPKIDILLNISSEKVDKGIRENIQLYIKGHKYCFFIKDLNIIFKDLSDELVDNTKIIELSNSMYQDKRNAEYKQNISILLNDFLESDLLEKINTYCIKISWKNFFNVKFEKIIYIKDLNKNQENPNILIYSTK